MQQESDKLAKLREAIAQAISLLNERPSANNLAYNQDLSIRQARARGWLPSAKEEYRRLTGNDYPR
jgi:ParB-like chromosome segregation protein Spo0J